MKTLKSTALIAALIVAPVASFAQTSPAAVKPEEAISTARSALAEASPQAEIELLVREEIDGKDVYIIGVDHGLEDIIFVDAQTGDVINNQEWLDMVEEEMDDWDDHHEDYDHDDDDDDYDDDDEEEDDEENTSADEADDQG